MLEYENWESSELLQLSIYFFFIKVHMALSNEA